MYDDFFDIEDDWSVFDKFCEMLSVNYVMLKFISFDEIVRDLIYDDCELI